MSLYPYSPMSLSPMLSFSISHLSIILCPSNPLSLYSFSPQSLDPSISLPLYPSFSPTIYATFHSSLAPSLYVS